MLNIRLKEIRKSKQLTQKELAILSRVSESKICRIEKGVTDCNTKLLCKLADILEVSTDELLGRSNANYHSSENMMFDFDACRVFFCDQEKDLIYFIREDENLYMQLVTDPQRFYKRLI